MNANWWEQRNIRCPYFLGSGKREIRCEGPFDGASITLVLCGERKKRQQEELFCAQEWEKCEICRMIEKAKY